MSGQEYIYELPNNIERYLASLSKLYAQDGRRQLQEIIVNAQIRVVEGWSQDNWNGGTYGHALYMMIPESLFLNMLEKKEAVQTRIKSDLNKLHNIQNEFIEELFLEMEVMENEDWRKVSGLLAVGKRTVPPDGAKRIWGDSGYRVFLSHKSEVKKETAALKKELAVFGISSFVAHSDIQPTTAWQDEIENALQSMDAFVALMTESFHDSDWTDQEVGFAFARAVPIIALRLGRDPYGFIGKFQGLSSAWQSAAEDLVKILIKNDRMFGAYLQALRQCSSWETGNALAKVLPGLQDLTPQQIDELVAAYNETNKLHGSFGFNGSKPFYYGPGLVSYLNKFSPREFEFAKSGLIRARS